MARFAGARVMVQPPPYDFRDAHDDEDEQGRPKWRGIWIILFALLAWGVIGTILLIALAGAVGLG